MLSRSFQRRTVWLIGTGLSTGGKRWNPVWPFIEGNPVGSPASSEQVQELARPFCAAIDALAEHNRTLPRDQWPVNPLNGQQYKPLVGRTSQQIGELSLGLELSTLLGVPVFSFISDSDAGNELVCLTAPGEVRRACCQREDGLVLEFVNRVVNVSPECPPALAGIAKVRSARPQRDHFGNELHEFVRAELNAYAGDGFADGENVLPEIDELVLVGERTGTGKYQARHSD